MAADPNSKHICVIGSGASGLTAIKCCVEDGHRVTCYEMCDDIGGLWRYSEELVGKERASVMKSTVINTAKEMMAYSDFPIPAEFPVFCHNTMVLKYFRLYADKFDLIRHIQFHTKVESVRRSSDYDETGQWVVRSSNVVSGEEREVVFDGVLLCTGHHASPYEPNFDGLGTFQGRVLHSHDYKTHKGFEDKNILIIGIGNSGGDIAVELGGIAKQVYLSTRRGTWVYFRIAENGLPLSMVYSRRWWTKISKYLPARLLEAQAERRLNKRFDHANYGLKPNYGPSAQHPMVNDSLPNRIASGLVKIKPDVSSFTSDGVLFKDGTELHGIDAVILATGYTFGFPYLEEGILPVRDNKVELYKHVFPPRLKHPTLAVVGCIQPLGSVMPISEMQCRWFCRVSRGQSKLPHLTLMMADVRRRQEEMGNTYVQTQRHTIQVDFIPYMSELSVEVGCDPPSVCDLLRCDPLLALQIYCGPLTAYQFRLCGPHPWSGAKSAIESQWQRTVRATKPDTSLPTDREQLIVDIIKMAAATAVFITAFCAIVLTFFW